ncbi:LytR/AlgR family response regulator transcription factor [Mangrovibacterium sp.]|uniref:LytR/AlgR family response regulator transcription factor n=1 Tax=Mangrovibacterium sp. TaxID=1961364 RepID=UPI0035674DE7
MIKCIAIDDEPLALQQLELYVDKTPFIELVGTFESALEALVFLNDKAIDLMFVDIEMPNLNGMDFVKSLTNAPKIIFTTAYSQYAAEGFKVEALDYLLKPLDYATFLKSANKAKAYFERFKVDEENAGLNDRYLFLKSGFKMVRVAVDQINFIEGKGGYLKFHIEGSNPIMTLLSMKSVEEKLSPAKFMRVHRSYLVNLHKISLIERGQIVFGKVRINVSEQYKAKFQAYLDRNSMN